MKIQERQMFTDTPDVPNGYLSAWCTRPLTLAEVGVFSRRETAQIELEACQDKASAQK